MSTATDIHTLAANTPADRNRAVDALRAISILVVVFGHWLMAAVVVTDGTLVPGHLLGMATWAHPLTWLLQVMPIFFLVGGYANGVAWRGARRRGDSYGTWLRARLRRLALPVMPLLAVWTLGGWLLLQQGLDHEMLQLASQVALVPTWFLATYVGIVALTPLTSRLWDRFGWASVVAGIALAAAVDVVSIGFDVVAVGFVNYVFVWATVHQLGYAWLDDRFGSVSRRLLLALAGLAATAALVTFGPYPVAMVGLDGAEVANSYPARVTLATLGLFQAGLVLAVERPLRRWLDRRRPWTAVVAVNAQIMSLYLWHLTAMVAVIGASLLAGGAGMGIEPLTGLWWLTRPMWFVVVGAVTLALVALFGRFERPRPDSGHATAAWRPLLAVASVCAGLGLLAAGGIADADGLNGLSLALPFLAAALLSGRTSGSAVPPRYSRT